MSEGFIFNIQKFSIHDGPGIRTTIFFKGCPLNCQWCHNPESISSKIDIMYDRTKCTLCNACVEACMNKAISIMNNSVITDKSKCNGDRNCELYCINEAREIIGKNYTKDKLINDILKDKIFFEESKGGVTFSGGEALLQIEFLNECLIALKAEKINTAIDTCGYIKDDHIKRIINYTDLFLYDLKMIDDLKHIKYTGKSNRLILDNFDKLSKLNKRIIVRVPIIEGINAEDNDIKLLAKFLINKNFEEIHLLPYHDIAKHKHKKLLSNYDTQMSIPSNKRMEEIKKILEEYGYQVNIGG